MEAGMYAYKLLLEKLEGFIKRYYYNELIKGAILFVSIGLLYFLLTLLIEYFLWLDTLARSVLFWTFVLVEALLLVRFLLIPLLKLWKLSKGLGPAEAAKIIGAHFPEVGDKLLNVLQLGESSKSSELLMASIDQKSSELQPIPFKAAIDFRVNLKYLKFAVLPLLLLGVILFTGNSELFADSYTRMVNYKTAYEPPAPFSFQIINSPLEVKENERFKLQVQTPGTVQPSDVMLHFDGQAYYLTENSPGSFQFVFEPTKEPIEFYLSANGIRSRSYALEIIRVPSMLDFEMFLDYPSYTGLEDEVITGSGNAKVVEGTKVSWKLETRSTEKVEFLEVDLDTVQTFKREGDIFSFEKDVYNGLEYKVATSNLEVQNYEELAYELEVVKDQYPVIEVESRRDSINMENLYFYGKVSDDYAVSRVELVYYPEEAPDDETAKSISISEGSYAEFFTMFPDSTELEEGVNYELYFRVIDNDALRNGKMVKSRSFQYRSMSQRELEEENLQQQGEAILELDGSLERMEESAKELRQLSRVQKESGKLDFNERKRLQQFLERQEKQNQLMKNYTEKLKNTLEEKRDSGNSELGEELQNRLLRKEGRLEENEVLLEELKEYTEKISEEELGKKLDELSKRKQNQERSLEQLLELTKRYYVEEKSAKVARDLEQLSESQESLSEEGELNTKEAQDSLNESFEELQEEIEELERENKDLEQPMDLGTDENSLDRIREEQRKASENLGKQEKEKARQQQKNAGEEMKSMASKMKKSRQASAQAQMQEDVGMLRQILDNLLVFSFEQEVLLKEFREMKRSSPQYSGRLRRQNSLRENFRHVDDSLYSLALRNPMISEQITERLTDIEFDLEKSLERLAQNEIGPGVGSQQYVVTGTNDLAYLLNGILENMQDKLQPSGSSGGEGEQQLPDLIQKQKDLNERMEEGTERHKRQNAQEQGEDESGDLFEIFQEQQRIREALEKELEQLGLGDSGEELKEELEEIEEELLEDGFNENTLKRMQEMEHRMLDLEDARLQEGRKEDRQSEQNESVYEKPPSNQILKAKEYFNTTEILNRQSLPLRQIYQQKVREYFERGNN